MSKISHINNLNVLEVTCTFWKLKEKAYQAMYVFEK